MIQSIHKKESTFSALFYVISILGVIAIAFEIKYSEEPISHGMHTHDYYELLYVLSGEVNMIIRGKEYLCGSGSLVFLNPFDEHASKPTALPYKRYYLLIPQTQLKAFHNDVLLLSVFRFHGEQFPYVIQAGDSKPWFDQLFSMLRTIHQKGGQYADTRIEALMTLILTDAQALRPDMFLPSNQLSFLPIQDILNELDVSLDKPFSLEQLAKKYHVSPNCLSVHFRRSIGLSPMQYVTQSRLARAQMLLSHSEIPVTGIAQQCGFPDVSNFVRRFRSQFHCTPLQFRRQKKEDRV